MSDKELEERLARLRGLPTSMKSDPPITVVINQQASKTQTEQSDELLKQMISEAALDSINHETRLKKQQSTDEDIAYRLARLRGLSNPSNVTIDIPDVPVEVDSEEESEQLAKKLLAEASLPDFASTSKIPTKSSDKPVEGSNSDDDSVGDNEELPWCTLCNEDAAIRCYGCENDLFCKKCFKEFHRDPDMRRHKTTSYAKKKNPKK